MVRRSVAVFAFLALVGVAKPSYANLIANGGFETGSFSSWTNFGNTNFTSVTNASPHSGTYAANLGPVGSDGNLIQFVTTAPGQGYTFSYWLKNDLDETKVSNNNSFAAEFNGVDLPGSVLTNAPAFGYTEYVFNVVATGTTSSVGFRFRQDPSFFRLDDVSLEASRVPEPASLVLLGTCGIFGLGCRVYRRRKSST
jgi:hypothetical protein